MAGGFQLTRRHPIRPRSDLIWAGVRDAIGAVEPPDPPQHAGGDVEQAIADRMALRREIQQMRGLRIDGDFLAAAAVDLADDAVGAIAAVFGFDAARLGLDRLPRAARQFGIVGFQPHFARRRHGMEGVQEIGAGPHGIPRRRFRLHFFS